MTIITLKNRLGKSIWQQWTSWVLKLLPDLLTDPARWLLLTYKRLSRRTWALWDSQLLHELCRSFCRVDWHLTPSALTYDSVVDFCSLTNSARRPERHVSEWVHFPFSCTHGFWDFETLSLIGFLTWIIFFSYRMTQTGFWIDLKVYLSNDLIRCR